MIPGFVMQAVGNKIYVILLTYGRFVSRHVNQVKFHYCGIKYSAIDASQHDYLAVEFSVLQVTDTAHNYNIPNTIESMPTEVGPESVPNVTINKACVNPCAEEPVIHEQQAMSETPPTILRSQ